MLKPRAVICRHIRVVGRLDALWLSSNAIGGPYFCASAPRRVTVRICRRSRGSPPTSSGSPWPVDPVKQGSSGNLLIGFAAMWVWALLVSGDGDYGGVGGANPPHEGWAPLALLVAAVFVCTAIGIVGNAVVTSAEKRRARGQLPPGPRPGGHTLDGGRRGGTGHGPVPPAPRTGQTRADLRVHQWRHRQHSPARAHRTARGVRPAPGAV